jgi:hypothetical protein
MALAQQLPAKSRKVERLPKMPDNLPLERTVAAVGARAGAEEASAAPSGLLYCVGIGFRGLAPPGYVLSPLRGWVGGSMAMGSSDRFAWAGGLT